jgi:putative ABC transport system ATP-binding protein
MIYLKKIVKSYRVGNHSLQVLKSVDLAIEKGELVSIMGTSGSGKSTMLNILGILDSYDSGIYKLNNTLIKNLSERKAAYYRNQFIGFVFQSFNLLSFKNAMENVALPLYYQKVGRKKRNMKALEYLEMVGLRAWADHMPSEMSGGQKQRVAIARSLISRPKVILADEPTGALDSKTTMEVMNIFKEVNRQGITVVIVTHENEIADLTDRIIFLKDGQITKRTIAVAS